MDTQALQAEQQAQQQEEEEEGQWMEELEKHGTPCTEHGISYAHRCLCRRTPYKWNDYAHAHKCLCRHTACSGCTATVLADLLAAQSLQYR